MNKFIWNEKNNGPRYFLLNYFLIDTLVTYWHFYCGIFIVFLLVEFLLWIFLNIFHIAKYWNSDVTNFWFRTTVLEYTRSWIFYRQRNARKVSRVFSSSIAISWWPGMISLRKALSVLTHPPGAFIGA